MSHPQLPLGRRLASGGRWAVLWWLAAAALAAPHAGSATHAVPPQFDDPPLPFAPRTSRSETDADRVEAQALFATARLLHDRSQLLQERRQGAPAAWYETAALRKYQRAFRRDPQATRILRPIIALAQASSRIDEAARYAAIATERDPSNTPRARWLALYYADQGRWHEARRLYETIVATRAGQSDTATPPKANLSLWLELGRLAYLTEQHAQASAAFTAVETALRSPLSGASDRRVRAVLLDNTPLAFQLFGAAHLAAGNLDAAEVAFRRACEGVANRGTLAFHLARIAHRRHDPERAKKELQGYFDSRRASQGIAPYQLLADLLADQGEQERLVGHLEKLHQNDADNHPLMIFLARQHLIRNQLAPAETLFRETFGQVPQRQPKRPPPQTRGSGDPAAIDWHPVAARGDHDDYRAEALEGLTEIYRRQGDAAALLRILAKAAKQTDSLECLEQPLAKIISDQQLLDKIFHQAEKAEDNKTAPDATTAKEIPGVDLAMAELALAAERSAAAAHFYQRAIDRYPDRAATLLYDWGAALLDREHYVAAADVFQQGIARKLGPEAPARRKVYRATLYFFLAGALEMTGDTDHALAAAQQAEKLRPDSALIASRQPWICRHAKRLIAARQGYRRLIDAFDLKAQDRPTRKVLRAARFELSQLAIDSNDLPAAEQWLEQILDEDPRNIGAQNDLGFLWADQGKHLHRALVMVRTAVDAEPDNRAYRDSLGWTYFQLGHYLKAIDHLEKASIGDPPDGVVLDHLGDCYKRLDRHDDAIAAWQRSVRQLGTESHAIQAARVQEKLDRDRHQP
jgi:tetratricopeptide (TPR) repeat protein